MPDSTYGTVGADVEEVDCDNCGAVVSPGELFHNERLGLAVCESCDADNTLYECDNCGAEHDSPEGAVECCLHYCSNCGASYLYEEEAMECCWYSCEDCGARHEWIEDADSCCRPSGSDYPRLSDSATVYEIAVPAITGRPGRLCSIEQEVIAGGREAAQMLYDYGFAGDSVIENYSWSPNPGRVGVCSDGSLPGDGGEIIYSRFNLALPDHVRVLSAAAGRMRQLAREAGVVRVGKAAGIHIHISATAEDGTRISPVGMTALHELFCYAEDAIYGIAAAGWDAHRQSPSGGGYCRPVPKIDQANAWRINRAMRSDRYFGLNFGRLLASATRCSCGAAQFGAWEDCECGVFDAATVEWRVFNASTKPETIHAWLLLAHAMTAYAERHPVGTLPVNEYGSTDAEHRWEVLDHLMSLLPLTAEEVEVIYAAARRSPLFKRR
jgi:hypothetical protein